MGQRLLRTRNKIAHAGISFRVPDPHRLADRTAGVLAVIYLVFNEGYAATEGETFRDDLGAEAVPLADLVAQLLPHDDEVHGLRALLSFQHSRRAARTDEAGEIVTMEERGPHPLGSRLDHGGVGEPRRRAGHRPPTRLLPHAGRDRRYSRHDAERRLLQRRLQETTGPAPEERP